MLYIIGIATTLLIAYCMWCKEEEQRKEAERYEELIEALTSLKEES